MTQSAGDELSGIIDKMLFKYTNEALGINPEIQIFNTNNLSTDELQNNLSIDELQKAYNLMVPRIFYATTEYIDASGFYQIKEKYYPEYWVMHPDLFPGFKRKAEAAGYTLVHIRDIK